jgi:hypothetical protein
VTSARLPGPVLATPDDLERIADGWRALGAHEDGWFLVPNGEILGRVH